MIKTRTIKQEYYICDTCGADGSHIVWKEVNGKIFCSNTCSLYDQYPTKELYVQFKNTPQIDEREPQIKKETAFGFNVGQGGKG